MASRSIIMLFILIFSTSALATETIVFIGDSLTEGYQLPKEMSYPSLIEEKIKKENLDYKVINGGVSGSTSASGMSRLNWFLKSKPKILVLALGANDGLRGLSVEKMKSNLSKVIEKAKTNGVSVLLAGMQIPSNYGEEYTKSFEKAFKDLSKKFDVPLIPFLLKDVAGKKELNLPDGIHPNQKGYIIVANTVYEYLRPML